MKRIQLKAMAKINLGLDVVADRPDGYHDLRMVMQSIRLFDRVVISVTSTPGVRLQTNLPYLPTGPNNLASRAAQLLIDEFSITQGVFIDLEKRIPVAAGLAGGSSDAAAVLVGMNILFCLNLSEEELRLRGVKLGADVPFCIARGTYLAEGIGDVLTRLDPIPDCSILIAKPDVRVSTKQVYTSLVLDENTPHPDIDAQIEAIKKQDLSQMCRLCGNVLETVTETEYPEISSIKKKMLENGALCSMMSGSGPTVFGIFEDRETAMRAQGAVEESGLAPRVILTSPFTPRKY